MKDYKLVASHHTIVDLCALIETRWGWLNVCVVEVSKNIFKVMVSGSDVPGCRIIKRGARYRLEMEY